MWLSILFLLQTITSKMNSNEEKARDLKIFYITLRYHFLFRFLAITIRLNFFHRKSPLRSATILLETLNLT